MAASIDNSGRDYGLAALVTGLALVLYLLTLCPTIWIVDGGELTAVPYCWGVAHPPGYPLMTMVNGLAMRLLPFVDPAWLVNLITALSAALAVGVFFQAARWFGMQRMPAVAAALGLALAERFWVQALSVEVYALDALLLTLALACAALLFRDGSRPRRWMWFGLICGLSMGHRPPNLVYLALLWGWLELWRRHEGIDWRVWLRALVPAALTGLVYLYLPLAAAGDPPLNMGEADSWEGFRSIVTARVYGRHFESGDLGLALERLIAAGSVLPAELCFTLLAALIGLLAGTAAPRGLRAVLLLMVLLNHGFTSFYNILDNEGFFQPSLIALALLAGFGWQRLAGSGVLPTRFAWLMLVAALLPISWTYARVDRSGQYLAEQCGRDLLASAEDQAVILLESDTGRTSLNFQQIILGRRPDVAVISPSNLVPWHVQEVRTQAPDHPLPQMSAAQAPGEWLGRLVAEQFAAGRSLYIFERLRDISALLPPELQSQVFVVPQGLLFRLVPLPDGGPEAATRLYRELLAVNEAFWVDREIPRPSYGGDPEFEFLVQHYAKGRLLSAREQLRIGDIDKARVHLEDLAQSGIDERERRIIDAYRRVGAGFEPKQRARRAGEALELIRGGASADRVLESLRDL